MKLVIILIMFALSLLASPVAAATMGGEGPILVRGPYLTPVQGGILLHLRFDQPAEARIEYGEEEICALNGTCPLRIISPPAADQRILLAGLSPGTRYRYRVFFGGKATGDLHFLTCPETGPVTFLVMGDSRDEPPAVLQEERFGAVATVAAAEPGVSFVIHTGDFVLDGNRAGDWDRFFRAGGVLLANTTLLPARGNHDGSPAAFAGLFGVPPNYTFACGDVQVAVLDSADDTWGGLPGQAAWLGAALAGGPPVRFAALHHPLLSSDERHPGGWENLRGTFAPVLARSGVLAVFQGHVHLYERDRSGGTEYITEARAGAPPYRLGEARSPDFQAGIEDTLGYSRVTVVSPGLPALVEPVIVANLRDGKVTPVSPVGEVVERVSLPPTGTGALLRGDAGISGVLLPGARDLLARSAFLGEVVDLFGGAFTGPGR